MPNEIPNNAWDIIDSRDIIARIDDLESETDGAVLDESTDEYFIVDEDTGERENVDDEYRELETLRSLADEAESYAADWQYGETLIRDSYFTEYTEQLAEDIGAINKNFGWPHSCIDWERAAEELKQDYTAVDFDGVTYWIR